MMQAVRAFLARRPALAKILGNAGWQVLDRLLRMGVGVIVSVWIARALGPEEFGTLNWMLALVGLLFTTTTMGLNEILVRELVVHPEDAPVLLGTGLVMQLAGALIGMAMILGLVVLLRPGDEGALWLALVVAPTLLMQVSDVLRYHYQALQETRYIVWVAGVAFVTVTIIRVVMLLTGAPMIGFAFVTTLEMGLAGLGMAFVFARHSSRRGWRAAQMRFDMARARSLLAVSWPMLLTGIALLINMKIELVMLGQLTDDATVGIYTAAVRLSELWYFLPLVIAGAAFPAVIGVYGRDDAAAAWQWRRLYAAMLWLAIAAGVAATLVSGWLVPTLFGQLYAAAAPVLTVHIWAGVSVCLGLVWGKWMLLEGRQHQLLIMQLGGAGLNVGLNFWLIPLMGAMGAAWATLGSYLISMVFGFFLHQPRETLGHLAAAMRPWRLRRA
jgi:PST family polysaccharide transporter